MTGEAGPESARESRWALPPDVARVLRHGRFLVLLLLSVVIDGLFLLGTFYWASLINGLMDQELSDPVENFLFVAVRLALTVPPAVIVIFYTMCDLAGALRRVWSTR